MPKLDRDTTPETLRPYLYHGVNLSWKNDNEGEAIGDCPFCGREGKFSVKLETGVWRCFVCAEGSDKGGGNAYTFLRVLWEMSDKATLDYGQLAEDRGLMNADTLATWGVCRSIITNEWLTPGYGINRHLNQLYKYIDFQGKKRLLLTPTLGHQMSGLNGTFDPKKQTIYICEGFWDGVAFWEVMSQTKSVQSGYAPTASIAASLLNDANVISIPGCETFFENWLPLFLGKDVVFLLDNDHDRKHPVTKKIIPAAGYRATQKHVEKLGGMASPPKSVKFLQWSGEAGKAFDPELPSGHDIRDELVSAGDALGDRITALGGILGLITPVPKEWLGEATKGVKTQGKKGVGTTKCEKYELLVQTCKKAMKWIDGLDCAFSVMLASIVSTMQLGDQLWVKVIGPASCGKSTLCEAVSANKEYVYALSTLKGFYSGWKEGEAGGQDYSLIAQVKGKTLVIKDGDTLLQLPNKAEVLSQARDIYDTVSRSSFKTAASNTYEGVRMTFILCGTSALRAIDSSELGERFLDCVIMEGIDDDLEDEILWRVAHRAEQSMSIEATGEATKNQDPEATKMMQMTGGYIDYLRKNATELLSGVEMSDETKRLCTRLGKFVAFMRARPSTRQDENAEREFAARLVSQHIRLAKCLSVVLNSKKVCDEAIRRTVKVAMDTARGLTLNIVKSLYRMGRDGMTVPSLVIISDRSDHMTRNYLKFLRQIGVLEAYRVKVNGVPQQVKWRLTTKVAQLYHDVTGEEIPDNDEDDIV